MSITGVEIPEPLPSPSRRLHELTMAMATRSVAAKVESATFKQATVGDLKGQYVLEGLTLVRDEDETLAGFVTRCMVALDGITAALTARNHDDYRAEFGAKALTDELAKMRGGAE